MEDACIILSTVGIAAIIILIGYAIDRVTAYFQQLNRNIKNLNGQMNFTDVRFYHRDEQLRRLTVRVTKLEGK